jgi:hypothetical protein
LWTLIRSCFSESIKSLNLGPCAGTGGGAQPSHAALLDLACTARGWHEQPMRALNLCWIQQGHRSELQLARIQFLALMSKHGQCSESLYESFGLICNYASFPNPDDELLGFPVHAHSIASGKLMRTGCLKWDLEPLSARANKHVRYLHVVTHKFLSLLPHL